MPRYTIDRFEGDEWVVLETDPARTFTIPRRWLPQQAREGDVLNMAEDHSSNDVRVLRFELDVAAREERLNDAHRLRSQLRPGPKGDVSL